VTPTRLAAVDVGTNSTRLLVADVAGGAMVAEHAREMVIARLGKGVDRTGRFDPDALARTLEVLAGYAQTCRRLGVTRRRVVATSAPPATPPTGGRSWTASAACSAWTPRS
jgi:exopolyphosphatase / guanosine-5'-triphosphate,3'-diphosphate pyrophosphatase